MWLFWAAIIGGSIASSAAKAKKKREEDARRAAAAGAGSGHGAGAGADGVGTADRTAKPGPRSLAEVLEEIARQATEQPSPTVSSRPLLQPVLRPVAQSVSAPQPAETSHDYYSFESEYDAMDGHEYRGDYSAEDPETEIAAYEHLAAKRAGRSTITTSVLGAGVGPDTTVDVVANRAMGSIDSAGADNGSADSEDLTDDDAETSLREFLGGGGFDLRHAVIETEILTPKYVTRY